MWPHFPIELELQMVAHSTQLIPHSQRTITEKVKIKRKIDSFYFFNFYFVFSVKVAVKS